MVSVEICGGVNLTIWGSFACKAKEHSSTAKTDFVIFSIKKCPLSKMDVGDLKSDRKAIF
jgi:hypothetical protein